MARLVFSILAEKVIINRESNNLSLIETISAIQVTPHTQEAASAPTVKTTLTLVSFWTRTDLNIEERAKGSIMLYGPSGKPQKNVVLSEFHIDLVTAENARSLIQLTEVCFFEGSGRYELLVKEKTGNGTVVRSRTPLDVHIKSLPINT